MSDLKDEFVSAASQQTTPSSAQQALARGSKHIGGYYDPDIARKLRQLALDEDSTVQSLLGEAILMLLRSRGMD